MGSGSECGVKGHSHNEILMFNGVRDKTMGREECQDAIDAGAVVSQPHLGERPALVFWASLREAGKRGWSSSLELF